MKKYYKKIRKIVEKKWRIRKKIPKIWKNTKKLGKILNKIGKIVGKKWRIRKNPENLEKIEVRTFYKVSLKFGRKNRKITENSEKNTLKIPKNSYGKLDIWKNTENSEKYSENYEKY